jgi:hypothetical protein
MMAAQNELESPNNVPFSSGMYLNPAYASSMKGDMHAQFLFLLASVGIFGFGYVVMYEHPTLIFPQ